MKNELLKIGVSIALVSSLSLYAKESKAISGLDVSSSANFNSNAVWRGTTQTDNSPCSVVDVTFAYSGVYLYADQYASAISGLGMDLGVGYANNIDKWSYDIGYINYGWMGDSKSTLSYKGWDELYLKNSYNISNSLITTIYLAQRFFTQKESTVELSSGYTLNKKLSIKVAGGTVISTKSLRKYAQLNLSHPCLLTGGTWGAKVGWSSNTKDIAYGISHRFSF